MPLEPLPASKTPELLPLAELEPPLDPVEPPEELVLPGTSTTGPFPDPLEQPSRALGSANDRSMAASATAVALRFTSGRSCTAGATTVAVAAEAAGTDPAPRPGMSCALRACWIPLLLAPCGCLGSGASASHVSPATGIQSTSPDDMPSQVTSGLSTPQGYEDAGLRHVNLDAGAPPPP